MTSLNYRHWVPEACETYVQLIAQQTHETDTDGLDQRIHELTECSKKIHEVDCFNFNPATNVMNPRAEALLSAGLGTRPSLGYPGDKYEMGLGAIEQIEIITAELCAEIFQAQYVELRVASGAMANLYGFMATCNPGDTIIAPPASIGGHVTHLNEGCAGMYGLNIVEAPIDAELFTMDVAALADIAKELKPKLITIGGSLNLFPHPVAQLREIADDVNAKLLFDAAHQCGIIAGRVWPNPLQQGAHLMTMSTYKSLAGPAGGLLVSNDVEIAQRLDEIAFPGMTANFDVSKTTALGLTLLDWREHGESYAQSMVDVSKAFANALDAHGIPVYGKERGFTESHQFAIEAVNFGGGQRISKHLEKSRFLASGIALPIAEVANDLNGLRLGTPELTRWGVTVDDVPEIVELLVEALSTDSPERIADKVSSLRRRFAAITFVR